MSDDLRKRLNELHQRRDQLEKEAIAHEQTARDKRAERDRVKSDIAELASNIRELQTVTAAQNALAKAEEAKNHAESHASQLEKLRKEHEELNQKLKEKLETLGD